MGDADLVIYISIPGILSNSTGWAGFEFYLSVTCRVILDKLLNLPVPLIFLVCNMRIIIVPNS